MNPDKHFYTDGAKVVAFVFVRIFCEAYIQRRSENGSLLPVKQPIQDLVLEVSYSR